LKRHYTAVLPVCEPRASAFSGTPTQRDSGATAQPSSSGQVLVNARHDDEGLTQLNKTIEMDPNFAGTYGDLSTLYRYQGHYDLWLDALKKNATLNDSQEDLAAGKRSSAHLQTIWL
jgi:hypothetical protein